MDEGMSGSKGVNVTWVIMLRDMITTALLPLLIMQILSTPTPCFGWEDTNPPSHVRFHVGLGLVGVTTIATTLRISGMDKGKAIITAIILTSAIAFASELTDNRFSVKDIGLDAVGMAGGTLFQIKF